MLLFVWQMGRVQARMGDVHRLRQQIEQETLQEAQATVSRLEAAEGRLFLCSTVLCQRMIQLSSVWLQAPS